MNRSAAPSTDEPYGTVAASALTAGRLAARAWTRCLVVPTAPLGVVALDRSGRARASLITLMVVVVIVHTLAPG